MWEGRHKESVKLLRQKRVIARLGIGFETDIDGHANELCVVDTGADVTTIPQRIWQRFISKEDARKLEEARPRGVGGSIEVRKHHLALELLGLSDSSVDLGMCDVWLAFDEDARTPMNQVLFGVGGGSLAKGGLCINWKQGHFWYVEVEDK